jgi:hypothetical protein
VCVFLSEENQRGFFAHKNKKKEEPENCFEGHVINNVTQMNI